MQKGGARFLTAPFAQAGEAGQKRHKNKGGVALFAQAGKAGQRRHKNKGVVAPFAQAGSMNSNYKRFARCLTKKC